MPTLYTIPSGTLESDIAHLRGYKAYLEGALIGQPSSSEGSRRVNMIFGKVLSAMNRLISEQVLPGNVKEFGEFEVFMEGYINWNDPSPPDRIEYLISLVHQILERIDIPASRATQSS